ncbi:PAQR family membrane homeostasis protein TrhA [Caulobacter hibisci]|uniref:Hemolysin III family protein n=1 Tax=Caulobacter hibisci TaxID=2035993 RepID=A0ABS0SXL2_9CAUL|nr:hemolysin III family protein [Caulobacter hibisci]MBI1684156.1 hemolysin III family protein [Caulobacter hibisci]
MITPRPAPTVRLADEYLAEHYPNAFERAADRWIHLVALLVAAIGAAWLVERAMTSGRPGMVIAAALYGAALICMLSFSAIYNLSHVSTARPALRRLDEAGIFLMIAGSYTPFTTQRLDGAWAIGMTALVWSIALAGILGKLAWPTISERAWTGVYVVFGWVAVLVLEPLRHSLPVAAFALLVAGGLTYTGGALLFLNPRLPYRRAVWHGFVCAGAGLHFAAIACGVVLGPAVLAR